VRAREEGNFWKGINVGLPLFLLAILGWTFNWRRKRKYAR